MDSKASVATLIGFCTLAAAPVAVHAADGPAGASDYGGFSITSQIGGFIRSETALNTNGTDPFNQNGNAFNGRPQARTGFVPGVGLINDTTTRNGAQDGETLNMQIFRGQLDATFRLTPQISAVAKLRGIFDPGAYNEFDPASVHSQANGYLYGKPNYFNFHTETGSRPNPLEWSGQNFMIDFPALFVEFNQGPLDVRVGNQQIAWGQAIFFRVLDVPDGLDLRRHSVLDYVPEEYSDKRVPAAAIRASYQYNDWLLDSYVQKFQPTVYGNPNTPYNIIPSQFTVHDLYGNYDNKFDFGTRLKGQVGDVGVQLVYAHRHNPDGVFRWTASNVNRDIPGLAGSGAAVQCTPFEVDPTGVWSANEWMYYAAQARLNGVTGLNAAVNDFQPCSGALGAAPVGNNFALAHTELDTFFQLAGGLLTGNNNSGLRGHIARDYKTEDNIGGGLSYTTSGPPGSLTDQLILNWELLYTPTRTFTSPDLGKNFVTAHEWTTALVAEKYQRFFNSFPATYLVGQFMYKSQSDLFGRYLGGMGGTQNNASTGYGGGFKAIALAIQQPFPNLIWRVDLAVLYDLQGGILVQPAVRWKPNGHLTVEAFYNYLNSSLGGNPNNNIMGGLDYARELTLRVGYQF